MKNEFGYNLEAVNNIDKGGAPDTGRASEAVGTKMLLQDGTDSVYSPKLGRNKADPIGIPI